MTASTRSVVFARRPEGRRLGASFADRTSKSIDCARWLESSVLEPLEDAVRLSQAASAPRA